MNAEFNWWLLIVGLVVGAGLVWLVIADWSRREEDVAEDERAVESAWIANALRERGAAIDPEAAQEVLELHREYLRQAGTLEQDGPADWDDSTGEPAWPAEGDARDPAWPAEGETVPAPGAEPASGPDDTTTGEFAPAQQSRPATSEGLVPDRSTAPPLTSTPSVRAMPLSPRGTGPSLRGEPDPEQREP